MQYRAASGCGGSNVTGIGDSGTSSNERTPRSKMSVMALLPLRDANRLAPVIRRRLPRDAQHVDFVLGRELGDLGRIGDAVERVEQLPQAA